nr:hypothetical protein [Tanacetum cinerariifolium]
MVRSPERNDDIEVTPSYTPSLSFLTTMEPTDSLLIGDEDSSTTLIRKTVKFINSSANDLVPIPREFENMYRVDGDEFMRFEALWVRKRHIGVANPRALVYAGVMINGDARRWICKRLCAVFLDGTSLGCIEEFEDISILDPPKSAPLNYEPLGNHDSVSRSLETSDLNLEEVATKVSLDNSIPSEIGDGILYDREDHYACFQSSNHSDFDHLLDFILGILYPA